MQRIVAIDDDAAILQLLCDVLADEGYDMVGCARGADAYGCVREARPDAVILDLHLETNDAGWAVLDAMRADAALRETPVLVCTADARDIERHAADLRRYACIALIKPFDVDELIALVRRVIERRDGQDGGYRRARQERRAQHQPVGVERRGGRDRRATAT